MEAPLCPQYPYVLSKHKTKRNDPYYWLNQRDNPEMMDYLKAENAYCDHYFKKDKSFIDGLFEEMKGRIVEDDSSVPYLLNEYWYQSRYEKGKEYPIYARRHLVLDAPEEILLDVNELAKDESYYNIGGKSISPNNKVLCYGEDKVSRRIYTLRFKNLETGTYYSDYIDGTTGSAVWAKDNKSVFYTKKDEQTLRSFQIWKHELGTAAEDDVLVFEERDAQFDCFVYKTKCKNYIVIGSASTTSNEYRYIPADQPNNSFKVFLPRKEKHEYSFTHFNGKFYMLSNHEEQNFALYACSANSPELGTWETVISGRENVMLESVEIFRDFLVLVERASGLTQLRVITWDRTVDYYIPYNDPAYSVGLEVNVDVNSEKLRYTYTSLTTPTTIFEFNLRSKAQKVLKQQKVLGDFNPEDYESKRVWAISHDGTKVPISIVYKKGYEKQDRKPLLLYGYGSYGISMDPYFSTIRLSLLNRGFAFAIAHIRGGEELGRAWYENAKWLTKKNTFYDFIACGKHLVAEGFAGVNALYAMGGSAGGMLMGAVINLEPKLWAGVIASVPFVDVVTTMLDDSIPLTTGEYEEWGNPNEKAYFDYMLSYSPYDNVKEQDYPSLLVISGYHDSQVQYWEPTKWVAKLRTMKTNQQPLLLNTNLEAGHGGASGRFEAIKEVALEYAFILGLEGIHE